MCPGSGKALQALNLVQTPLWAWFDPTVTLIWVLKELSSLATSTAGAACDGGYNCSPDCAALYWCGQATVVETLGSAAGLLSILLKKEMMIGIIRGWEGWLLLPEEYGWWCWKDSSSQNRNIRAWHKILVDLPLSICSVTLHNCLVFTIMLIAKCTVFFVDSWSGSVMYNHVKV